MTLNSPGKPAHWRLEECVRVLAMRPGHSGCVAALADGRLAWLNLAEPGGDRRSPLRILDGHRGGILAAAWSPDGTCLASAGEDGRICWWTPEGGPRNEQRLGRGWAEHLVWVGDGRRLVSASGRLVGFWDAEGAVGRGVESMPGAAAGLAAARGDGRVAVATRGGIRLMDPAGARADDVLPWKSPLLSLAWSADGTRLAAGTLEKTVLYWEGLRAEEPLCMSGYESKVEAMAWDASCRWLATGGGEVVTVWDASGKGPAGTRPLQLRGHEGRVSALAFAPRGSVLASGADDGSVYLWNVMAGEQGLLAARADAAVTTLAWASAGGVLAWGSASGVVGVVR